MHVIDKKMALAGWLQKHDPQSYSSSLKLQKFLFLYEAFSKAAGEEADFEDLYGYSNGPVYKTLYEQYRNEKTAFSLEAAQQYEDSSASINKERVEQIAFIMRALSEEELSEFSHKFNIWASKRDRIDNDERNVKLHAADFNSSDLRLADELGNLFPLSMIRNSTIIQYPKVSFVLSNRDAEKLTSEQREILEAISEKGPGVMGNPLFVEIEPDGCLAID